MKKILIVDDEPNIVLPLQFLMEQKNYQVHTAASGEEAIEALEHIRPDLILLDIMLPGMNGFQVCEIVRLNPACKHTKIIFLSARGRDVDVTKGTILGGDAYIIKPFANAEVVAKVKQLLKDTP
ncbi:MAG: response regulator [Desulfatitalea sp.]|nr:response regulator [Desulfatitalea sp.]NNK01680.1 response regulator [Desulfatitalea sp.]